MARTSNALMGELVEVTRLVRHTLDGGGLPAGMRLERFVPTSADPIDSLAQALVCGRVARKMQQHPWAESAVENLCGTRDPVVAEVLRLVFDVTPPPEAVRSLFGRIDDLVAARPHALEDSGAWYFFESFLAGYDRTHRARRGVYFTPPELVRSLVETVDEALRLEFGLPAGLADTSTRGSALSAAAECDAGCAELPAVRILDPAVGAGAFLLGAIERVYRTMATGYGESGGAAREWPSAWSHYVAHALLPRLTGYEILLPAVVVAKIRIAMTLAGQGVKFDGAPEIRIEWRDSMAAEVADEPAATVVMGNPPFSGISASGDGWIRRLMRGEGPDALAALRASASRDLLASYFLVDGKPLGERKHWLDDDYVKFMRLAHWHIERAGWGLVALVTNHGYLDNPTFRGMRQALLATFPRITVADLHGNRKKGESPPDGGRDESVFRVDQGVALSVLRRVPADPSRAVTYTELWGTRQSKLSRIAGKSLHELPTTPLEPGAPYYFFVPRNPEGDAEYRQAVSLADIMPVNTTAPVTARDSFVVAFDERELIDRFRAFRDLAIPDGDIRSTYFQSTRSTRYQAGDTRGWNLQAARRDLAERADWKRPIRACWYRPFDRRVIYWSESMVDWPRWQIMRHFLAGDNLGLIARRQMLPTQQCNYFWITDDVFLDGLLRSDNRGSESVFPLFLSGTQPNIAPAFQTRIATRLGSAVADRTQSRPAEIVEYIYALFHSPDYRQRYADGLRVDFPRVFVPRAPLAWTRLARLGRRLIDWHLGRRRTPAAACRFFGTLRRIRRSPRFDSDRVWISESSGFEPVGQAVWNFRVGGHQVCRKWLADRRGRELSDGELRQYAAMVAAIRATRRLMTEVDQVVESFGGWSQLML